MQKNKLLFLTLKVFSATGGIEKVCRIAGKVFVENTNENGGRLRVYAMHDVAGKHDPRYFPNSSYNAFNGHKLFFGIKSIISGLQSDTLVLSHINLLIFGFLIKLLKPSIRLVLLAHGIEVWPKLNKRQDQWLTKCDLIICVSHFTRDKMQATHSADRSKYVVINNCLDPFLPEAESNIKSEALLTRYNLTKENIVLLTLSRLSAHDRDKGYDKVLNAMRRLNSEFPTLVYMIAGKYDVSEKQCLDELIEQYNLKGKVLFTGYVIEDELAGHFSLCDIYLMPSIKEGFGIIFIEAMYYGKPVIGGNRDGSVDALQNGKFGILVDPENQDQIINAIRNVITNKDQYIPFREDVMKEFGYDTYKSRLLQAVIAN